MWHGIVVSAHCYPFGGPRFKDPALDFFVFFFAFAGLYKKFGASAAFIFSLNLQFFMFDFQRDHNKSKKLALMRPIINKCKIFNLLPKSAKKPLGHLSMHDRS